MTGATSGIGLAIAKNLAQANCNLVFGGIADGDAVKAREQQLREAYGIKAYHHGADLKNQEEIADLMAFAKQRLGAIDILVNNAGIQHVAPVEEFPQKSGRMFWRSI